MVFQPNKTPCRGPSEMMAQQGVLWVETPLCPEKSEY